MGEMSLLDRDREFIWHPFTAMQGWLEEEQVVIERGDGVMLYDTEGRGYIDGVSSLWCNVHGHNHPHINERIRGQLEKIAHSTLLGLASGPSIELARRLVDITPAGLNKVFYSDSGATAVEIALKMAFQYWRNIGRPKGRFVALKESYHGDTLGSVSVGGIGVFHRIFGPLTFEASFVDSPHPYRFDGSAQECCDHCLDRLRDELERRQGDVAAIVVEPLVQGAAGIIVHPKGYLSGAAQLAREYDALLIVDEVATGFGRTGTMFACEQEGVSPDLFCVAKGLTGGYLPLAATLANDRVFGAFLGEPASDTTFYHGHTFTGNALGCAAALGSLEVFERERTLEGVAQRVEVIEQCLRESVAGLEIVGDVRQCGMMVGIEVVEDRAEKRSFDPSLRVGARLCRAMRSKGVILRPLGDVVVVMPPLAIPLTELERLLVVVVETIAEGVPA